MRELNKVTLRFLAALTVHSLWSKAVATPNADAPKALHLTHLSSGSVNTLFSRDEPVISFWSSWPSWFLFFGLIKVSQWDGRKKRLRGWTKNAELIFFKNEENHICEVENGTSGNFRTWCFSKKGFGSHFSLPQSPFSRLHVFSFLISLKIREEGNCIFHVFWHGQIGIVSSWLQLHTLIAENFC